MSEETRKALEKALRECGAKQAEVRIDKSGIKPKYRASDHK